jgi:L-lactate dehydrogenase complex protein LldG
VVARFVERVEEYGGRVVSTDAPVSAIADLIHGRAMAAPRDLPAELRPPGAALVEDDRLSAHELDALDGALTTCACACADTGTIALTGGRGEGRRALTLVPDLHVCVVRRDQIVETVPELFALLEPAARDGRPIVLVSGPSATSDIELQRVEGVHGPRTLVVVLAG